MHRLPLSFRSRPWRALKPLLSLCVGIAAAHATNGYFDYGYGIKAKGAGGAGVAFPQDSLAPATNPAGAAFVEDRADLGLAYFRPDRSATLGGTDYDGNETEAFVIPDLGVKKTLGEHVVLDLAIYGNGGMNTDYKTNLPAFGTTPAGVDLAQVFIAPALAVKAGDSHSFGIAPIFAYQRFKAHGLQNFGVADAGYDDSYGAGLRVGYTGRLASWLSVGATYQSRVYSSRFEKYEKLFAEQGDFDIPSNFAAGVALRPAESVTLALDIERIRYSEVASVGNLLSLGSLGSGLGSDQGPGFGWRDVTAVKTGLAWNANERLTLRAGYNHVAQPIRESQSTFNILAPGVVQDHVTAGFTWRLSSAWELNGFYAHAFRETVHGTGSPLGPATDASLTMKQDTFGLGVGWLF